MRKKIFTLLLAVAASVGTMFASTKIGNLYYNLDATNHTAEVTSQNSSYPYWSTTITTAIIPASVTYNSVTYSVTSIGDHAFYMCTGLTSVTIPNSVTSIGWSAFEGCSGLTSVTIPNSVTSIGDGAFRYCDGLTSVTIPNSVTSIGGGAFFECRGLTSVTIGNSVTSIGAYAFSECTGLTSVTIPNSVTSIGEYAFSRCRGLTSVTIGNSVTSIGGGAFRYCTGLTSIVVENGNSVYDSRSNCNALIETATNTLIVGCMNTNIPNSVTGIGVRAFYGCSGLTSVTIPNSVTSIGNEAFYYCTGLTSVTIGNSVTGIGDDAFYGCRGLTSVTIPNSVTSIGDDAFYGCRGLTSVTIPNSVTSIGDGAFRMCTGLTSVTIPNSVTSIGDDAFYCCYGLTSVTIPNSVTSIGDGAFAGCSGMTSVTIGNSVTSIGGNAFSGCTGLTSITCEAVTPPTLNSIVFDGVDKSIPLYVPAGSVSAYQSADVWKDFTNILPIGAQPADVTTTTVTPSATTADITWPQVAGADTYTIEIKKNGELICTLTFNAQGQLISIAFNAPSRNNAPQQAQAAGFSFTVTSLDSGTTYSYTMTAKDNNGNVLKTESGTFTTTGDAQGVEEVLSNQVPSTKILHNGQVLILRGEKVYSITGQEVK